MPTTTSITAVSVSIRSAQATTSLPEVIQLATGTISACSSWPSATEKNATQESSALTPSRPVVTQLGGARADLAAEQAGDQEAEQRQEDDQIVHGVFSPSAR